MNWDIQATPFVLEDFGWAKLKEIAYSFSSDELPPNFFLPLDKFYAQEQATVLFIDQQLAMDVSGMKKRLVLAGYTDKNGIPVMHIQYEGEKKKLPPTDGQHRYRWN